MPQEPQPLPLGRFIVCVLAVIGLIAAGLMIGLPYYNVFHQHMAGKAMLAKAEYSKGVLVQDAKAREESADFLARAEIKRAEGVAKANKIIGDSLQGNEAYLHYLWIHNLEAGDHDVVYVPTEAGLPIFEAGGRFQERKSRRPAAGEPGSAEHPEVLTKPSTAENPESKSK